MEIILFTRINWQFTETPSRPTTGILVHYTVEGLIFAWIYVMIFISNLIYQG